MTGNRLFALLGPSLLALVSCLYSVDDANNRTSGSGGVDGSVGGMSSGGDAGNSAGGSGGIAGGSGGAESDSSVGGGSGALGGNGGVSASGGSGGQVADSGSGDAAPDAGLPTTCVLGPGVLCVDFDNNTAKPLNASVAGQGVFTIVGEQAVSPPNVGKVEALASGDKSVVGIAATAPADRIELKFWMKLLANKNATLARLAFDPSSHKPQLFLKYKLAQFILTEQSGNSSAPAPKDLLVVPASPGAWHYIELTVGVGQPAKVTLAIDGVMQQLKPPVKTWSKGIPQALAGLVWGDAKATAFLDNVSIRFK